MISSSEQSYSTEILNTKTAEDPQHRWYSEELCLILSLSCHTSITLPRTGACPRSSEKGSREQDGERLARSAKRLEELPVGIPVVIQNQTGRY